MRTIPCLVWAIIVVVSSLTRAIAQDTKTVNAAIEELNALDQPLDATYTNLSAMSETASENEYAKIQMVLNGIERARASVTQLLMVSSIFTTMRDQRDTNTVRRYLSLACKAVDQTTTAASGVANKILPRLVSPALVQEVTKARDQVDQINQSKLCKTVPAWKS